MVLKHGAYERVNFTAPDVFCHGNLTVISLCILLLKLSLSTI